MGSNVAGCLKVWLCRHGHLAIEGRGCSSGCAAANFAFCLMQLEKMDGMGEDVWEGTGIVQLDSPDQEEPSDLQ